MKRILLIDHYDSFVYNLKDELAMQDVSVDVYRSSWRLAEALQYIHRQQPAAIVLSPGPGAPSEATLYGELLQQAPLSLPILGVCLGHQAIVEFFGGKVGPSGVIMHGKSSLVTHDNSSIFAGLPNPLPVGRYHSLAANTVPDCLRVTAVCDNIVMAVQHKTRPIVGVQFHPESVLTPHGPQLVKHFLELL